MPTEKYYLKKYGEKLNLVKKFTLEGKTAKWISNEINLTLDVIYNIRKDYELNASKIYLNRVYNLINKEELIELILKKFTLPEIAKHFNVSNGAIKRFLNINNIIIEDGKVLNYLKKELELNYEEEQVLIGGLFGDTYLGYPRKNTSFNATGSFTHCLKQKEFIFYKYNFLKRFCSEPKIRNNYDKRSSKFYQSYNCQILSNKGLNIYRDKFYINNIKIVPEDLLYKLDGLGLAIWFMDDGNKPNPYGYLLCTNSFSFEDLKKIKTFFKIKFNIDTTIHKNKLIYITAQGKKIFKKLIEPYMETSMLYKL